MPDNKLRIATRKSPLALWQAEHVRLQLQQKYPELEIELVRMVTQGDKILDAPLAKIGGKALFVKELELAMLEGDAEIAVHSMKDVPVELPEGLHLPVILQREEPLDAFVSTKFSTFTELPEGARVGTSSLRRQCQLLSLRPDLKILSLRGNVGTRLQKLDDGDYEAIILSAAGLIRLGMKERITEKMSITASLPAIGQGAIGIECRNDDERINNIIATLNHGETQIRVKAERALNQRLKGGCQVPIGGYAVIDDGLLTLHGLVGQPDGSSIIKGSLTGPSEEAEEIGFAVADDLLSRGAGAILKALYVG